MDPQTIKLIQRLLIEITGIGILVWGLIFIYRGIAGKINFVMKGGGFRVKLANATPGVFIAFIGAVLIWLSVKDFSVEKKTITKESDGDSVIDVWLNHSESLKGTENYIQIIDQIVGKEPDHRFTTEYLTIHPPRTLGDIALQVYQDRKYWKLLAAINAGKDYFDFSTAGPDTKVTDSSLIEIWRVSKFYGKTTEEVIKVSGQDKAAAYARFLEMAKANPGYHPLDHMQELTSLFKDKELGLVETPADFGGGVESIGDLSLKYYGDKTLWPLITWTNPIELSTVNSVDEKLDKTKRIFILHFLP